MISAFCTTRPGYICCIKLKTEMGHSQIGGCAEVKASFWDYWTLGAVLLLDAGSLHLAFKKHV